MNSNKYIHYVIINLCEVYKEVKLLAKLSTRKTNISENKVMKKTSMNLNFEIYKILPLLFLVGILPFVIRLKLITLLIREMDNTDKMGIISDGYHSFDELYYQRMMLTKTVALAAINKFDKDTVYRSKLHSDGTTIKISLLLYSILLKVISHTTIISCIGVYLIS